MPTKRNKQGKTRKEIDAISDRLYSSGRAPAKQTDMTGKGGKQLSKEEVEAAVERLYEKDPNAKRKEIADKHNMNMDKDRPDGLGWQSAKDKDEMEAITSRLFIADYNNRNVGQEVTAKVKDKEMSKEDHDAMIERLHISGYTNRNFEKNKQFYDVIMKKKKAEEKVFDSKEEFDEAITRLSKITRDPASCNKEQLGIKTYKERGIYGTYAMNNGGQPKRPESEQRTKV